MSALLDIHLACCVPLAIDDLQRRGGPLESDFQDARDFASELGSKGDQILYRGPETKALVSRLARSLATLAFCPGGARFGRTVYCAAHHPMGVLDTCGECR